jgi:CBS domain containing-hemolysin-like protein
MELEQRRLSLVLRTIAIALVVQCIAAWTAAGWVAATLLTGLLLGMFVAHTVRHGDALLARILLFGLVVGFGELPPTTSASSSPRLWCIRPAARASGSRRSTCPSAGS